MGAPIMKRLLPFVLLLGLALAVPQGAHAQIATPAGGDCTVDPMPQARIDELAARAATPAAMTPAPTVAWTQGAPVGDELRGQLNQVVRQAQMCAYLQDLPRLLSLYTDRFIVEQFFGAEPVTIVQTESGTPTNATPVPMRTDQEQFVMDAVRLPDGRVAAVVSGNAWGGNPRLYLFVQQDGHWQIDEIGPAPNDLNVGGAGNVTIPADAATVVELVLQDAATRLGVAQSALSVESIEPVEWPDAALGCPEESGVYAQVVSPGYRIIITGDSTSLEYHTGLNDAFATCAP